MRNPFLTKNPFMSAWLSAANRAAGTARGHATAAVNRDLANLQATATQQITDFWMGKGVTAPAVNKRKKKKR